MEGTRKRQPSHCALTPAPATPAINSRMACSNSSFRLCAAVVAVDHAQMNSPARAAIVTRRGVGKLVHRLRKFGYRRQTKGGSWRRPAVGGVWRADDQKFCNRARQP